MAQADRVDSGAYWKKVSRSRKDLQGKGKADRSAKEARRDGEEKEEEERRERGDNCSV